MEWLIPYKIQTPCATIPINNAVRRFVQGAIQAACRMLR